ncbi:MAG: ubiquitin-like protein Pup [Kineosporiaceae bacterium]|nr:ubiquitin-like protein Pup [Kineosporiaceae bacterium]
MAGQEQKTPKDRDGEPDDAAPPPPQSQAQVSGDDVDAILDEIDDVLETNAEEFVKGFVQKGGQ